MTTDSAWGLLTEPEIPEPDQASLEDGVVDEFADDEFERVFSAFVAGTDSEPSAMVSPGAEMMVRIAVDQRRQGIAESPPGSNSGPPLDRYVRWFIASSGPLPWCAFFLSWCLDRGTDSNRRVPWTYPGSVSSIYQWAAGAGRFVHQPVHGDIFGIGGQHTGVVAGADGSKIWTVEGNYQDKVASVSRTTSGLWFARI